jgi:hypothetical protein
MTLSECTKTSPEGIYKVSHSCVSLVYEQSVLGLKKKGASKIK